jgi:hypothetical protein
MQIRGKEYCTIVPVEVISENDVQRGVSKSLINIYIHNKIIATQFASAYDENHSNEIFGNITKMNRTTKYKNLKKIIEDDNDPVSVGSYKVLNENKIKMIWNFYYDGENELVFNGEILLNGDAIKGTFYKNGEINVPERVYYNVDKPLPDPLILEEGEDIV